MKLIAIAAVAGLALAGCTTTGFLGTGTPCEKAALVHAAFVTAASVGQIPAKAVKIERAAYAGVSEACRSGSDLKSVNLVQLVNAYVAAADELKKD